MELPEDYKPWIRSRIITPEEKKLDEEIEAGLYEDIIIDPFPFSTDENEDDYGEESNP